MRLLSSLPAIPVDRLRRPLNSLSISMISTSVDKLLARYSARRRKGIDGGRHHMHSVIVRIALLVALTPVAACAPWPHIEYLRPSAEGRLLDDGKPIAGAEVFLGAMPGTNDPCAEMGDRVATSAIDGSFHVSARSRTALIKSLLSPASETGKITAICIRRPGADVQIGALIVMFIDMPTSVSLDCDVSKKKRASSEAGNAQISSPLGQPQLCQAVRVPRDAG